MKQSLLLVVLFFAAHSALGQSTLDPAATDTYTQQQVEPEPVYQQLHDIPPQLRTSQQPLPTPPRAVAHGQTGRASGSEQWQYDPAARWGDGEQKPANESGIERALRGINPCNVPYGGLLAEWRIAVMRETIENIYYWSQIISWGSLMLACFYIAWLHHEREDRLQITSGIIAQLWNAHMFARDKALESIEAHNKLVEWIDAEEATSEEQSAQSTATSPLGTAAATTSNAPGSLASPATKTRKDSALAWAESVFEEPQKGSSPVSKEAATSNMHADQNDANEAVPLSLRAARWQEMQPEQLPANAPIREVATDAGQGSETLSRADKDAAPSDAEDVDAIKRALQKATETLNVQAAQLATKDAQLKAKDDKITSQRQLVSDLNNKLKANGATGSGA